MIATGSIILANEKGWSCAKEASLDMDITILPNKMAKRDFVINNINGLYDVKGNIEGHVHGIFKSDDGKTMHGFEGDLLGRIKIMIKGKLNNNIETILKQVKLWQEY